MPRTLESFLPYICLLAMFLAAVLFRPLLPVAETRYLSVAWEMFLQKQYVLLTLNFQPYHHKPPILFWLINAMWWITGPSRWSALIPIFSASAALIFLTQKFAEKLLPMGSPAPAQLPWLMLGSVPFLIYATLIMFDVMVTIWLLGALLLLWDYAHRQGIYRILGAGVLIGLGVLTKGPVMYLYVLLPLLLYPFWRQGHFISARKFYTALAAVMLISVLPVLAWLIPTLGQAHDDFAFWLVWNQTAGRVSGNFSAAHARPFFFYLFIVPLFLLPWIFMPALWRNVKSIKWNDPVLRFLAAATLPAFVCFSLISGKQPHYLLPLLPFSLIGLAHVIADLSYQNVRKIALAMTAIVIAGQAAASWAIFDRYDLSPYADFYKQHRGAKWAFVDHYQGELGFLARQEEGIADLQRSDLPGWFAAHPNGYAMVLYKNAGDLKDYNLIFTRPYRTENLAILSAQP